MSASKLHLLFAGLSLSLATHTGLAGEYTADPCTPRGDASVQVLAEFKRLSAQGAELDSTGRAFDAKCKPLHPASSAIVAQCRLDKGPLERRIGAHDAQVASFNQALVARDQTAIAESDRKLAELRQKMQELLHTNRDMGRDIEEWTQMNAEAQTEARATAFFGAVEVAGQGMRASGRDAKELTKAQLADVQAWYERVQTTLPDWIRSDVATRLTRAKNLHDVGELIAYLGEQGGRAAALAGPLQQEQYREALLQATKGVLDLTLTTLETEPEIRVALTTGEIYVEDAYAGWLQHLALSRLDDFTRVIGDNARAIDSLSQAYKREVDRRSAAQHALDSLQSTGCLAN